MIREILFIIRLWGRSNDGILPSYTKTSESFDVRQIKLDFYTKKISSTKAFFFSIQVLAKLFSLITRLKEAGNPSNDAIIDECILLPSQGTIITKKVHCHSMPLIANLFPFLFSHDPTFRHQHSTKRIILRTHFSQSRTAVLSFHARTRVPIRSWGRHEPWTLFWKV